MCLHFHSHFHLLTADDDGRRCRCWPGQRRGEIKSNLHDALLQEGGMDGGEGGREGLGSASENGARKRGKCLGRGP